MADANRSLGDKMNYGRSVQSHNNSVQSGPNMSINLTAQTGYSDLESLGSEDAAWALICALFIFTMQTGSVLCLVPNTVFLCLGFAFLEMGSVTSKNQANIMIKNSCDALIGGTAYWIVGYALSFGPVVGGGFCGNPVGMYPFFRGLEQNLGQSGTSSAHYFFQLSFASTSTTIVSGAVAERMKLTSYLIYSFLSILIYSIPACWAWNADGFLAQMGYFDYAGVSVVHMSGGASALTAAYILGPRMGRYAHPVLFKMGCPPMVLAGTFMLWWAWLGFNASSTFAITEGWWRVSTSAAVATMNGSVGGGLTGIAWCMIRWLKTGHFSVTAEVIATSVLSGLVSVTGIAAVVSTVEAFFIGFVGAVVGVSSQFMLAEMVKIDDPVGAVAVHGGAAIWGTLAVGLFGKVNVKDQLAGYDGLFHSGNFRPFGVQLLGVVVIITWSSVCTGIIMQIIKRTLGIRISQEEEFQGADIVEHEADTMAIEDKMRRIFVLNGFDTDQMEEAVYNLLEFLMKRVGKPVRCPDKKALELVQKFDRQRSSISMMPSTSSSVDPRLIPTKPSEDTILSNRLKEFRHHGPNPSDLQAASSDDLRED